MNKSINPKKDTRMKSAPDHQGNTLGQQQQHPCSTHESGRERGGAHDLLQAIQILGWQLKGFVASEHEPV